MPVSNHDFKLTPSDVESSVRPAPGADRFGLQVVPNDRVKGAFSVALQGSIDGENWLDLALADAKSPMVGVGSGPKGLVVRYLRVVARTLSGDGAELSVCVVAK